MSTRRALVVTTNSEAWLIAYDPVVLHDHVGIGYRVGEARILTGQVLVGHPTGAPSAASNVDRYPVLYRLGDVLT